MQLSKCAQFPHEFDALGLLDQPDKEKKRKGPDRLDPRNNVISSNVGVQVLLFKYCYVSIYIYGFICVYTQSVYRCCDSRFLAWARLQACDAVLICH